jgi:hypothetical protein
LDHLDWVAAKAWSKLVVEGNRISAFGAKLDEDDAVDELKLAMAEIMRCNPKPAAGFMHERVFRSVQMSWRPEGLGEHSPWFRMFANARAWLA